MNGVDLIELKYITPAKHNNKVVEFKKINLKECKHASDHEFSFIALKNSIEPLKKAYANFVHIRHCSREKHNFPFYANIIVNKNNVIELP